MPKEPPVHSGPEYVHPENDAAYTGSAAAETEIIQDAVVGLSANDLGRELSIGDESVRQRERDAPSSDQLQHIYCLSEPAERRVLWI